MPTRLSSNGGVQKVMKDLLDYLHKKKRESITMSKDMTVGYEVCINDIKKFYKPTCSECGRELPNRRSKYCKPCNADVKEKQARIYARSDYK